MNQNIANQIAQTIKSNTELMFWNDEHYATIKQFGEDLSRELLILLKSFDPTINDDEFFREAGIE